MKLKRLILGPLQSNGYVISNEKKECIVIDPGHIGKKIVNYIEENELTLKVVLLTHCHCDHIGAVDYLYQRMPCPIYTHQDGMEMLKNTTLNLSINFDPFIVNAPVLPSQEKMEICGFEIRWLYLPGHCEGASMIYFVNENIIFSGDVLFKGSIGRYDFPNSSKHDMKQSLLQIKDYDFDAIVYPGHGEATSIKQEQQNNPFFN